MFRALFVIVTFLFFAIVARADDDKCYRVPIPGGPGAIGLFQRSERWCYRPHWAPVGSIFAYNADDAEAKPELAFIIDPDETLTHASLSAGRLSVHKVIARNFSPFSVPLREPTELAPEENPFAHDAVFIASVDRAERALVTAVPVPVTDLVLTPGTSQGSVPSDALPFRGYLWKTRNFTLGPTMAKLDTFARARGYRSNAYDWEKTNHEYSGVSWSGHCNGWAASSVLRKEPTKLRYDAKTKTTFLVSDQKGLLAELDYCVSYSFYGRRYPNGVLEDITPADFHRVVTYTIGTLGKPVAADLIRTTPVMNNVFSAYKTTVTAAGANTYRVVTQIKDHYYDHDKNELVGIAPSRTLTFRYTLTTDSSGHVTGGTWDTTNPDFLWVPLSGARCSDENPYVSDSLIGLIENLPTPP